jgi:hypothetical protein
MGRTLEKILFKVSGTFRLSTDLTKDMLDAIGSGGRSDRTVVVPIAVAQRDLSRRVNPAYRYLPGRCILVSVNARTIFDLV